MNKLHYYLREESRFIENSEILSYEQWKKNKNIGLTHHPSGFEIFLSPPEVINSDEYLSCKGDPYWEELNPSYGDAQKRIQECTVELFDSTNIIDSTSNCILDMACGKAVITALLRKKYENSEIWGLDNSLTAIEQAALTHKNIHFIVADAFKPPFADGSFDIVLCNNFLEHIPNPFALENIINKILKPEGFFIFSTPSRYNFDNLWGVINGRSVNFQNPTHHFTEYTIGQIKEQLKRSNFQIIKIISKPLPLHKASWKTQLKYRLVKPLIQKMIDFRHSHHILETTAFILARKSN